MLFKQNLLPIVYQIFFLIKLVRTLLSLCPFKVAVCSALRIKRYSKDGCLDYIFYDMQVLKVDKIVAYSKLRSIK